MTVAPALLSLSVPSDAEQQVANSLVQRLTAFQTANIDAENRYDGSYLSRQFGISIPPSMQTLRAIAGWPGTVVDVLEERLDWLGWTSERDDLGLDEIYAENALDVDSGMAHLDALIFGTSFVAVGSGFDGEPSPLITAHSPKTTTGIWDRRTRRLTAALTLASTPQFSEATLYLPQQTLYMESDGASGQWSVVERDEHHLGRVPVVQMPNRVRASRANGRSEITSAVRYYTDAAVRTLVGLEVNREFYNSPQWIALNIAAEAFQDANGNAVDAWSAIQGRVWAVPPNEDGEPEPRVQQLAASSPAPYLDQVRGYAQLLAAEAGFPASYLGFSTDNPASADAIRAGEARLVKRAERRQTVFGHAWLEVGRLALMIRDGGALPDMSTVTSRWRDAATPTRAAAADEATKLIGSGVLPSDSSVTYDRVGLTPAEQRQVEADKRRQSGSVALRALTQAAGGVTGPAGVVGGAGAQ